jgi:cell division protein FtsB
MITDEHVDKLYAEIFQKDAEIARLRAEIARLRAEVERLMQLAILMGRDAINSRREALKGGNDEVGLPNENHQSATAGA